MEVLQNSALQKIAQALAMATKEAVMRNILAQWEEVLTTDEYAQASDMLQNRLQQNPEGFVNKYSLISNSSDES